MSRLQRLLECVAAAVHRHSEAALARLVPFETSLYEVARETHRRVQAFLPPNDLRAAFRELLFSPTATLSFLIDETLESLQIEEEFRETLQAYLNTLPITAHHALRRPSDIHGQSLPESFSIDQPEQWLLYLPERILQYQFGDVPVLVPEQRPYLQKGGRPKGIDWWTLKALRGLGPYAEIWEAVDDTRTDSPTILKLVTDAELAQDFYRHVPKLKRFLELEEFHGIIPLRSIYTAGDVPCFEYPELSGVDLAGFMRDTQWGRTPPNPTQIALIVRRLAKVVGRLHRLSEPIAHGGIKPSNILVCPTEEGTLSFWITDLGWSSLLCHYNPRLELSQVVRRSLKGSYQPLYSSPQLKQGHPVSPSDDVYALGILWYQLLENNPAARPGNDPSWAYEHRRNGLSDGHARLIMDCLSEDPKQRPRDGIELSDLIKINMPSVKASDSSISNQFNNTSKSHAVEAEPEAPRLFVKPIKMDRDSKK